MALLRAGIHHSLHRRPGHGRSRRGPTLLAMAAASALTTFPISAIAVAIPTLHTDLGASIAELQWIATIFTLVMSASLIVAGRLADIFGRRLVLIIGAVLMAVGSTIAALAPTVLVAIGGVGVAGLGAAALLPASLSIVVNAYPPAERGLPIGIWGAASAVAQAIGPLAGGALTSEVSWRWIFWVCVIVAVGTVVVTVWAAEESRDETAERRIDSLGVALVAAALGALTLGVIQGPIWGFGSPQTIVLLAVAVVLGGAFVVWERRSAAPLVDLGLFKRRNFAGATIVLFVINFALIAAMFLLPIYLQELDGKTAVQVGILLLPLTGALVVTLPLGGPIADRLGALPPLAAGAAIAAAGLYMLSLDPSGIVAMALLGGGTGLALTPMNLAAMNAVPTRMAGSAGGLFTSLSSIGISLGIAVTGAAFNAIQLSTTVSGAAAKGIDLSAERATAIDGILAGSTTTASALEGFDSKARTTLEALARDAFSDGISGGLLIGAGVAAAGVVLALILIRRRPPADEIDGVQPVAVAP